MADRHGPRLFVAFPFSAAALAPDGERLALLNGEDIELRDDTLVIADRDRPVALAGIMGGSENAVVLISDTGSENWPRMSKDAVADRLVARIVSHLSASAD